MLARVRSKATSAGAEVRVENAAAQALALPDSSFDMALGTMMLHHPGQGTRRDFAAEVCRVVKPGGRVLLVDFARPQAKKRGFAPPAMVRRLYDLPVASPLLAALGRVIAAATHGPPGIWYLISQHLGLSGAVVETEPRISCRSRQARRAVHCEHATPSKVKAHAMPGCQTSARSFACAKWAVPVHRELALGQQRTSLTSASNTHDRAWRRQRRTAMCAR